MLVGWERKEVQKIQFRVSLSEKSNYYTKAKRMSYGLAALVSLTQQPPLNVHLGVAEEGFGRTPGRGIVIGFSSSNCWPPSASGTIDF